MKWLRFRITVLLWLVALVGAFLGGMRYGEYQAAPRWRSVVVDSSGRTMDRTVVTYDVNSPDGAAAFQRYIAQLKAMRSHYSITRVTGP